MPSAACKRVRVLIVDDSAIVRRVLSDALREHPAIEVAGTAPDPIIARDKILSLDPDVVTLDIEMPRMDGLTFLRQMMRSKPKPVIVISSIAESGSAKALEALHSGAVEVLAKPGGPYSVGELREDLPRKILAAAGARLSRFAAGCDGASRPPVTDISPRLFPAAQSASPGPGRIAHPSLIAIGASTGGTQAVEAILRQIDENCPPVLVTQHIPAGFSASFAARLNQVCAPAVKEASHGDPVRKGLVLVAPGGQHMRIRRHADGLRAELDTGPKVCYQRPSVDVLFESVAACAPRNSLGVILTGMGSDGAKGLRNMRDAGASTIAESEESCVVFGMPREAIRLEAAERILALPKIAAAFRHFV